MTLRARLRVLAALLAAACASDPTGGGELLVVSQIDVQPPGASVVVGGTQQFTATPKTSSGITVPNRSVTWMSGDQGIATVSTSGLVTGVAEGQTTITARVDDVTANVTTHVMPKPVASVTVEPPQVTLLVGAAQQLQATPRDAQGQALPNRPVAFMSDHPAIASVSATGLVLAISPGNTTIRATSEGQTGSSAITVNPRPATRLGFTTQPANGTAGQPLAPIRVAVQDELGGTIPDATTAISLSIADNAGGATLGGTVVVNAVAGVATFTDLVLDRSGDGYTLRANALLLSPAISDAFTIAPGAASRLAMATQPSPEAQSGAPLSVQPVVQIVDANGNAVSQAGVAVSAQIVGAGATLAGVLTVPTAADGRAVFTGLSLSGNAGNYSLRFVATGLTEVVSNPIALTPGTPTGLLLLTPPSSTAESGVPFAQQPVVQLRDDDNNPVALAGVPVSVAPASGGGTLAGVLTVTTNGSGQAAFAGLSLSGVAGVHTLAFSAPNLGQVVSPPITLTGGGPPRLEIVTQPSATASNGTALSQQPSVQLFDAGGNQVAEGGVVVTATLSPGGAITSGFVTATTNANGLAVFSNLSITGLVGTYRITFSTTGYTPVESNNIVLGPGPGTRLAFLTQPAGAAHAQPLTQQPRLQLTDMSGNPVASAGVNVTAALASGPGTLGGTLVAGTNGSGIATFVNLSISGAAGTYTIGFTAPGVALAVSDPIPLGAGTPTQLSLTTQPSANAASGAVFAQQPVIQLRDASNSPVAQAGVIVTAAIASGGGTLLGTATATTNAVGVATFTNLAISGLVGPRTLQFTATGLNPVSSNVINLTAGPANKLGITTQPSASASGGVAFPQQPVVQVQDINGNPVAQGGMAVTATIETGAGGTLGGTTVVVSSGTGTATFGNLALNGASGAYTLRFSATGLTPVVSSTITLGAGAATKLAITTQPSASTQSGKPFPQQPAIQLQDGSSNPVAQAGVVVTVTIQSGDPALSGTLNATTNGSGLATFTDLVITGLIGDRTLIFASGGLVSVISSTVTVTPGDPEALSITTQPSNAAQSGVAIPTQPAIQLRDSEGNAVSQGGVLVTATIAPGSPAGTLANATAMTNGSGLATFNNLAINGLVGTYTLRFTSGAMPFVTSNNITLSAGPAAKLAITTQPSAAAQNDVIFPTQPVIRVTDAGGNPVNDNGIQVSVAIATGAGDLGGTTPVATAGGVATFTNLKITGTVGTRTLQFTAPSLDPVTSNNVVVSAGVATSIVIFQQPPSTVANGAVLTPGPVVDLRDISDNDVDSAGVLIDVEIFSGGGTLGGTTQVATAANGRATFSDLTITGSPLGNRTLRFTHAGLGSATSNLVGLTAGPPASLTITQQPSATATNDVAFAQQPIVNVLDASGNPVANATVTVSLLGGGTLTGGPLSVTTDGVGSANFSGLRIVGLVGTTRNLRFTVGALPPVTSTDITLSAGAAATLAITVQPSSTATENAAFGQQPTVVLRDSGGNQVTGSGVDIVATLVVESGTGTLGGTTTVATTGGASTFAGLFISAAGTYRLRFSSGALPTVDSGQIVVAP